MQQMAERPVNQPINQPINQNINQGAQVRNFQNQNQNQIQNQNYQASQNYQYNQTQNLEEEDFIQQNNGNMNQQMYNQGNNIPINNQQQNYQQNNSYQQQPNINTGMDQFVRNTLKSRGINFGRIQSPEQIKENNKDNKKVLLENIQAQLALTKRTKLEELERKRKEDEQYLKDMNTCFPFGRGGGGAPIRNKDGKIVTTRRYLISDPKYNLSSIQVDDDYDDVWNKDRKFGFTEFKNRNNGAERFNNADEGNYQNMNGNGNMRNNNMNFGGTMPRTNSARFNNNNNFNNGNFANTMQYNNNMNGNYNMNGGNNFNQRNFNNGGMNQRPYSTGVNMNNNMMNNMNNNMMMNNMNNMDYQMNNNMNYDCQDFPMDQIQMNDNYQQPNGSVGTDPELNLSYDNYGMDDEYKRIDKESYRNDLLTQIKEKENRKRLEKERKAKEDAEEEERLRRENEELDRKLQEEKNRTLKAQKATDDANLVQTTVKVNNEKPYGLTVTDNKLTVADQDALKKFNQQEIESRMALNNEILKLREQMEDQKNNLFSQIQQLTRETQDANNQRFEALKEIEVLKDELSKQRADEELRRKYVYDVIRNDNSQLGYLGSQSHLPDQPVEKVVLPIKDPKSMYYEESIRHPNRIVPIPKLTELDENQLKHQSKFIDLETRDVYDGLELYDIKNDGLTHEEKLKNEEEIKEINHKGYQVGDDFGTLRSYYSFNGDELKGDSNFVGESQKSLDVFAKNPPAPENNSSKEPSKEYESYSLAKQETKKEYETPTPKRTPKKMTIEEHFNNDVKNNISANLQSLDSGHLEVNQIYNKNLERLRFLNEIENNLNLMQSRSGGKSSTDEGGLNLGGYSKDNFDDFINKLNNTCTPNY